MHIDSFKRTLSGCKKMEKLSKRVSQASLVRPFIYDNPLQWFYYDFCYSLEINWI